MLVAGYWLLAEGKFSQGENYRSIILRSADKILRCEKLKQVNKKSRILRSFRFKISEFFDLGIELSHQTMDYQHQINYHNI